MFFLKTMRKADLGNEYCFCTESKTLRFGTDQKASFLKFSSRSKTFLFFKRGAKLICVTNKTVFYGMNTSFWNG